MTPRIGALSVLVICLLGVPSHDAQAVPYLISEILPAASAAEPPAAKRYREGVAALMANDLDLAATAFEDVVALDPRDPRGQLGLAEIAMQRKETAAADSYLRKAVSTAPSSGEAHLALGRFRGIQGDFAGAEASLKRATELMPRSFETWASLADLSRQALRKPEQAIEAYRTALRIQPSHSVARQSLVATLAAARRFPEAITEAEAGVKLAPTDVAGLRLLGRLFVLSGRLPDALRTYDQVLQLAPSSADVRVDRGDVFMAMNDAGKAITEYETATRDAPTMSVAYLKLGTAYERATRWADAERAYLQAIKHDPSSAFAYNNIAWLSAERKTRLDDALAWIDKAIQLNPNLASFHDTRAWVLRARGDLQGAANAMEIAATANPPQARFHYRLGLMYEELGRTTDAKAAYQKALETEPAFEQAADARTRIAALR